MKIPRHGHPAVNLHKSTAAHPTASPTLCPISVPLWMRSKGGSPKPHSHINGPSLKTSPLPTLPLPTWRMGCFQVENMLNFLIREVCSSGSGWDGPSLHPHHPDLSEPWWVGDPGGIGTMVCMVLLGCEELPSLCCGMHKPAFPSWASPANSTTSKAANVCLM